MTNRLLELPVIKQHISKTGKTLAILFDEEGEAHFSLYANHMTKPRYIIRDRSYETVHRFYKAIVGFDKAEVV